MSLKNETDELDEGAGAVTLMTLHNAKGLEYPAVFLAGMEDGIFPHMRTLGDPAEIEEERRLAYVGMTRAMDRLYLTSAWRRMLFGGTNYNPPSRFLKEVPSELIEKAEKRSALPAPRRPGRVARQSTPPTSVPAIVFATTNGDWERCAK